MEAEKEQSQNEEEKKSQIEELETEKVIEDETKLNENMKELEINGGGDKS